MDNCKRPQGWEEQMNALETAVKRTRPVADVLHVLNRMKELGDFWITSGCICQSVWNWQNSYEPTYGMSDIDIVYFDSDTSYEKEDMIIKKLQACFRSIPMDFDIKNQARVHLWYGKKYGIEKKPYASVQEAISSWCSRANSIGIRLSETGNHSIEVYAPYGMDDMFNQIIQINPTAGCNKEMFYQKAEKWKSRWDSLTIVPC